MAMYLKTGAGPLSQLTAIFYKAPSRRGSITPQVPQAKTRSACKRRLLVRRWQRRLLPRAGGHGRRQGGYRQCLSAMAVVRRCGKAHRREERSGQGDHDQNLGNASIEIGGEEDKENEATIFVSSYDVEEDKDISLLIKATKPGTYTVAKAPPEGLEQGSGEGTPKGTPEPGAPSEGKAPAKGEKRGVED